MREISKWDRGVAAPSVAPPLLVLGKSPRFIFRMQAGASCSIDLSYSP